MYAHARPCVSTFPGRITGAMGSTEYSPLIGDMVLQILGRVFPNWGRLLSRCDDDDDDDYDYDDDYDDDDGDDYSDYDFDYGPDDSDNYDDDDNDRNCDGKYDDDDGLKFLFSSMQLMHVLIHMDGCEWCV